MSVRAFRLGCGLGVVLVCSAAVCRAQTESKATHGRTLELTEPATRQGITNLNQLNGRSGLGDLEDELSKSLLPFSSRGSLDGVLAPGSFPPPSMPVVRSQKLKDELERRQNWMYLSPDDLLPGNEDPNLLKLQELGLDGGQKKKTPLEQFYQRLEQEQKNGLKLLSTRGSDPLGSSDTTRDDFSSQDDSKLPGAIRDDAQNLKKILNDQNLDAGFSRGSFSDFFGFGEPKLPTKDDLEKHKAYMDEYRKVLGGSTPPPLNRFDPVKAAIPGMPAVNGTLSSVMMGTPHSGAEQSLGTLGTIVTPGMVADPNATMLNQWNPFFNPQPKVEPTKPTSISVPMPEAPRRRF